MFVLSPLIAALALATATTAAPPTPSNPSNTTTPATTNTSAPTYCVPRAVTPAEQSEIFAAFVQEFYVVRNVANAFKLYIVADYIQHNPYEPPNGAAGSVEYLTPIFSNLSIGVEVLHQGFGGGIGWVHSRIDNIYPYPRPVAIADIFEFTDSCVKEHWDVTQELPADATNPLALF
ncbi:hypothetical protein LTR91_006516 [Friedmanniomyces endolithicus]|uniref:SnoaL-like domain-containing protein n=1 Tax=Friedmanniomyces endolithicus TaxID=329885 RepID=A0A4U0TWR2_9PEZI|nr:hypothetical protein LTS09_016986 [Friedmanniomyces endolithicus]KAK0798734.1 hypothetical protein LTR75_009444 [Friedmanniomyces endolithicus]KAK0838526.1 hypothetical protein LTR03_011972 [Friedmanniomyces endolithicus]KAK0860454.1 hypothetical protein LTS02_008468 [Friedmanniomyces endolithicus]KAK0869859.1 hypothetical protein LTR87_013568 [Friedmanniomyces endolithicus]